MVETRRRRRAGVGSVDKYKTRAGVRWRWRMSVPENPGDPNSPMVSLSRAGFETMRDADADLQATLAKRRLGLSTSNPAKITLGQLAATWLASLDRDTLAASTIQGYEKIVRNHVVPHLGALTIDRITVSTINAYYQALREGGNQRYHGRPLSPNTVNKIHVTLGAIIETAVDDGLLARNPVRQRQIKVPKGSAIRAARPEIETWTSDELAAFLDWNRRVYQDELHSLWRVMAFTGMRRSEALALRWADWNSKTRQLSVRRAADVTKRDAYKSTKSGKSRVIDVDPETAAILNAWRLARAEVTLEFVQKDALIFGLMSNNRLRNPGDLNDKWARRLKEAQKAIPGLPYLTPKGLRHTHATILLNLGVPGKVIQERLGHGSIMITMDIYAHVWPTTQESAVNALAAAVKTS